MAPKAAVRGGTGAAAKSAVASKRDELTTSSSEESEYTTDESEDEKVTTVKKPAAATAAAKRSNVTNGKATAQARNHAVESSSSSSEYESSDEDETSSEQEDVAPRKKPTGAAAVKRPTTATTAAKKKAAPISSSEEDESSDACDSDDEVKQPTAASKKQQPAQKAKPAAAQPTGKQQPAKGKGKGKGDENLDDIFAELGIEAKPVDNKAKKQPKQKPESKEEVQPHVNVDPDTPAATATSATDADGQPKLSKSQLKKQKQKQKEQQQPPAATTTTATAAAETKEEAPAAPSSAEKKDAAASKAPAAGGGKKPSAAVLALRERLAKQKEEEERLRRAEEERIGAEKAEEERLAAEERQREEEKKTKRGEEKEKRERLRKEGKLLTPAQQAAEERKRQFLEQMKAQGMQVPEGKSAAATPSRAAAGKGRKGAPAKPKTEAQLLAEKLRSDEAMKDEREEKSNMDAQRSIETKIAVLDKELADLENIDVQEEVTEQPPHELLHTDVEDAAVAVRRVSTNSDTQVPDSWDSSSDEDEDTASTALTRRQQLHEQRLEKLAEWRAAAAARAKQRLDERKSKMAQSIADAKQQLKVLQKEQAERKARIADRKRREEEAAVPSAQTEQQATVNGVTPVQSPTAGQRKVQAKGRDLRSPICCILGHVDTGKTKLLDKIRQTNVQDNEAGGITQQIGATYFPAENIAARAVPVAQLANDKDFNVNVPGLLVIDTPGHESFTNLRSRGSSLCDIAILVVDIMHGLEPQTIESINLLKQRKTPFIVALNKIDRCYGWKPQPWSPLKTTFAAQNEQTLQEFDTRAKQAMAELNAQGLNCELYYKNPDMRKYVSLVPTSAITGEGVPDLLMLLIKLTQSMMEQKLAYITELQCTVLEVKQIEGYGTTLDVVLVNGVLHEGDTVVICGLEGPIVTNIRALLTPPPMREIRVKSEYIHHQEVKAAMGVKIAAPGLENAISGSQLLVAKKGDDIEELKDVVQQDLATILSRVDHSGKGVYVQASTLGSLEALLTFLEDMKIPVFGISIGPVHKKDVIKASVMLEKKPEYAVILAFDVKVDTDARQMAESMGVQIFTADIIYHLFDKASKYIEDIKSKARTESAGVAVFPVVLDILPQHIFNTKQPIVLGVKVVDGVLKLNTPLCVPAKDFLFIGKVQSIEKNHVEQTEARKGDEVAVKIGMELYDQPIIYGRHFDASHQLVSRVSRQSIDLLKEHYKDDMTDSDWKLVIKLKKLFDII